jgi:peroxiredoxin Q/BCP
MKRIIRAGAVAMTSLLTSKAVALQVGDVAPAFIAPSTEGEIELRRSVEKGPVVLAFYPADFTPG